MGRRAVAAGGAASLCDCRLCVFVWRGTAESGESGREGRGEGSGGGGHCGPRSIALGPDDPPQPC